MLTQTFVTPTGATHLFIGMADGLGLAGRPSAYDGNNGSFEVAVTVEDSEEVPEPSSWLGLLALVTGGVMSPLKGKQ